jgi:hypothetical protein
MTSAYWFSAPTAMMVPSAEVMPTAKEEEQPAASRAAAARPAHARTGSAASLLPRFGMAGFSQGSFGSALLVMIMILTLVCNAVGSDPDHGRVVAGAPASQGV